jgi:hypothetical protein
MIKYLFNHDRNLPGIGAPPQWRYFKGLKTEDMERIGNDGKKAFYA